MKNPCENCIVKAMCTKDCELLDDFMDYTVQQFDEVSPIGLVGSWWLWYIEERPQMIARLENEKSM